MYDWRSLVVVLFSELPFQGTEPTNIFGRGLCLRKSLKTRCRFKAAPYLSQTYAWWAGKDSFRSAICQIKGISAGNHKPLSPSWKYPISASRSFVRSKSCGSMTMSTSMMGLAVIPATEVLPTCSMLQYLPDKTESNRCRNSSNHAGQSRIIVLYQSNGHDSIDLRCA